MNKQLVANVTQLICCLVESDFSGYEEIHRELYVDFVNGWCFLTNTVCMPAFLIKWAQLLSTFFFLNTFHEVKIF